jgi:hypothetical protein
LLNQSYLLNILAAIAIAQGVAALIAFTLAVNNSIFTLVAYPFGK